MHRPCHHLKAIYHLNLRCQESTLQFSVVTFINKYVNIPIKACTVCNTCIKIKLKDKWESVEQVLKSGGEKNGWIKASTTEETIVHFALNKVLYEQYEPPVKGNYESAYDLPDYTDVVKILWSQGVAIGFYTLKLKGTLKEETGCKYAMTTLDTAYIRSSCRRKGYGISILEDLLNDHPDEDIGLSKPISTSMWNVLYKFLSQNIQYRLRFWEVEGSGDEGYRSLIWYSLKKKQKPQQGEI